MAKLGALGTFPLRLGGATPRVKQIQDGLADARGTAYDTSAGTTVWIDDHASARAVAGIWDANELLANQANPSKLTIALARWEKILSLPVDLALSEKARRDRALAVVSRTGATPNYQEVVDRLNILFAPVTFSIVHSSSGGSGVVTSWPGGWYIQSSGGSPPPVTLTGQPSSNLTISIAITGAGTLGVATFSWTDGTTTATGVMTATNAVLGATGLTAHFPAGTYGTSQSYQSNPVTVGFYSAVSKLTIVTVKPSWMTYAQYYQKTTGIFPLLDAFLPAWVTFDVVLDGPNGAGIYLDEFYALDNERFD